MSLIRTLWQCTLSPRLFRIYEISWKPYETKGLERWGDQVVTSFIMMWSVGLYALPVLAPFMYRRNSTLAENAYSLSKLVAGAGAILVASLVARGYSRATNPIYTKFMKTLTEAKTRHSAESKQELQKYEFEFWAWPVDFRIADVTGDSQRRRIGLETDNALGTSRERPRNHTRQQSGKDLVFALPCRLIAYIVAHTFALKLMYPGSMSLINWAMRSSLLQGRIDLIKQGGERFKLVTVESNEIDALFVDRRNKSNNGDILVITSEGNCGFYEVGIMATPSKKGYSVLGWNHPGFGGSTGAPYPAQEQNAIDCVMQFAVEYLGFKESNVILYGWSIGGYPTTWAAMNYPAVHSVVLDATFDDVLPLAVDRMPTAVEGIVRTIIREYLNLNIAEQLNRYNGTVLLIRRIEDEMVSVPVNSLSGNRGNQLLTKLLLRRYPRLFSNGTESALVLSRYLSLATPRGKRTLMREIGVNEESCRQLVALDIERNEGLVSYPSTLGEDCDSVTRQQLTVFLASKYLEDQATQHCDPLAIELFHPGWDPRSIVPTKSNLNVHQT
ncbi:protein ABHD16A isoform X2 [Orussus abietinus]|uniref:protein ABHD16A isoform X2 n=1 Tax=Orussus abietinus TaxID=222816 RepID=UPI000625FBE9|nr:protein ABHD16A isoform X2 [Orussus abietinus]